MSGVTAASDAESAARVQRLGLGTVQFGLAYGVSNPEGQVREETAAALLRRALDHGIFHLDTAPAYGTAEDVVGRLAGNEPRFSISTKTLAGGASAEAITIGIRRSISRLGRASVDAILIHDTKALLGPDGDAIWAALQAARDAGLCRMTGISAYADQNPRALAIRFRPGLMQVPVSLLDQRLVRDGTLAFLKDRGIVIHARSIFLQGLPFLKSSELPPRLRHQSGRFDEIRAGIAGHGLTLIGAFTGFALSHREIDVAIVGVTSIAQMDKFVAATCLNIDALDWAEFAIDDPVVLTPTLWTT